jgi:hypothetical protein
MLNIQRYNGRSDLHFTHSERKGSSNNSAAVALVSGLASKQRSIKFFALSDNSDGISGCIL